jgi:hypothetical protein
MGSLQDPPRDGPSSHAHSPLGPPDIALASVQGESGPRSASSPRQLSGGSRGSSSQDPPTDLLQALPEPVVACPFSGPGRWNGLPRGQGFSFAGVASNLGCGASPITTGRAERDRTPPEASSTHHDRPLKGDGRPVAVR